MTATDPGGGPDGPSRRPRVPGLQWVRRRLPASPGRDLRAGIVLGVESVPDSLASGVLAGVNPLYGLYGCLFGMLGGAVATSSTFMVVQATGAMSVVVADVPLVQQGGSAGDAALFTLTVLTGLAMLAMGLARLGSMVRFIPNAVMTGFVNAIAVNIVLSQLGDLTGYESDADNRLLRAADTVVRVAQYSWAAVLVGLTTIALILVLERTRLGPLGMVVAIALASALVPVARLEDVTQLRDITDVPGALPAPVLPDPSLVLALLIPAASLAFVGVVQGAAITSSVPEPDGTYPDTSRDFTGQGVGSIVSGLFQGLPVAGSLSATALSRAAGSRTRLATATAAAVMAVVVLLFADAVGYVALPALAGLLVVVGVRTVRPAQIRLAWRTGPAQAAVMSTTFVLTIIIPLQYAVLVGVAFAVVLYVIRQSNRIVVRRWVYDRDRDTLPTEIDPPATVPGAEVVVLHTYGSLFFAAVSAFEAQLPEVAETSRHGVVVIRLRGREDVGSTFIAAVTGYARRLHDVDGRLVLVGVSDHLHGQLAATGALDLLGAEAVYPSRPSIGAATRQAVDDAREWVRRRRRDG